MTNLPESKKYIFQLEDRTQPQIIIGVREALRLGDRTREREANFPIVIRRLIALPREKELNSLHVHAQLLLALLMPNLKFRVHIDNRNEGTHLRFL